MIDVAAGDKIPRKGGPGITKSDLLVINKIDLAPMVGASLEVMDRDARKMRGERPFVFTNLKTRTGPEHGRANSSSSEGAWRFPQHIREHDMNRISRLCCAFWLTASALPAMAHPFHSASGGFTTGFVHPFVGIDHLLAMVAVGMWAVQQGRAQPGGFRSLSARRWQWAWRSAMPVSQSH